ncbi:MAG: hypothetical protein JOY90_36575 [Bradyrhizobium sp.]|uniref:hypothetical protein n=1 Tax=Bradyrhizobium sp. TaxID=376 RepID=UPI001DBF66D3|nr:hypothetical protein [Bradyrhizobium sp.]MBV9565928.1 hypothetical protein [Bradyrhizobium sp.]
MSERTQVSRAVLEARKAFKPTPPKKTDTDYARMQQAFHENRERLKAERLAREAAARGSAREQKTSS